MPFIKRCQTNASKFEAGRAFQNFLCAFAPLRENISRKGAKAQRSRSKVLLTSFHARFLIAVAAALSFNPSAAVLADDSDQGIESKTLTVTARACETPLLKYRLLPAEYELRDGNAAPILLRLAWDQQPFLNQVAPTFGGLLEIPIADVKQIREAGAGLPPPMFAEMRRAAYRRAANWEYPIHERPLSEILLPDAQGSRDFARGLAVWIRYHIAGDEFDDAREGILVGLANARHYARTPFLINQLIAYTN